jgi:DNA-binding XRE family transcriptional regulator
MWTGDPSPINAEIRGQMGRRQLNQEKVAALIGIKRQAFARRLKGETPWRYSELLRLHARWGGSLEDFVSELPEIGAGFPAAP